MNDKLKRMITYRNLNLIEANPSVGSFDVIFCRNVLIYFDLPTKKRVLSMLHGRLKGDGFLLLGAAETVIGVTDQFSVDRDNRGLYKPAGAQAAAQAASAPSAPKPPLAAPNPFDRDRLVAGLTRR